MGCSVNYTNSVYIITQGEESIQELVISFAVKAKGADRPSAPYYPIYFRLPAVKNHPAHSAVNGATVTSPNEPMTVWISSAATYL